jgi:hypothetical protein
MSASLSDYADCYKGLRIEEIDIYFSGSYLLFTTSHENEEIFYLHF